MNELQRIGALARMLADELQRVGGAHIGALPAQAFDQDLLPAGTRAATRQELAAAARRYSKLRRRREQYFQSDIFADPAWDIMIDLFAAGVEGRQVSISSACIAAAVPPTTALRWLSQLERERMIERVSDAKDRRRTFVRLTKAAEQGVAGWLALMLETWEAIFRLEHVPVSRAS